MRHLISQGNAQCILGNHELNILRNDHKHGNHWFFGEPEVIRKDGFAVSFQVLADQALRDETLEFFQTLPIALERADLGVVHACWDPGSLDLMRGMDSITEAFEMFNERIQNKIKDEGITDPDQIDMLEQNENPVKVLCSGMEVPAAEKFFAGGKWRTLERHKWWEDYTAEDGRLIVIGHFWRRFMSEVAPEVDEMHPEGFNPTGADMFPQYQPNQLCGPQKKVMCVDYAAGVRYEERGKGWKESALGTHLAALRLPEMQIHLEDGRVLPVE